MKTYYLVLLTFFISAMSIGQVVVINEVDSNTPSTDDKEIIELKSSTPNFSLTGYVLVLFNGSDNGGDSSYFTLDLDGFATDINGIFMLGSNGVSPVPDYILFDNAVQNGADAVAIYLGDDTDFPDGTLATSTNLIDALAYDTNDPDDTVLLGLLGISVQTNEDENGNQTTESIQRKDDGTYEVKTPTPGALNDGSGTQFNGVSISIAASEYNEGDSIDITFTTQDNVTSPLNFDFTLVNGSFMSSDYSGSLSVSIPSGMNSATNTIQVIDDTIDDGDEVMKVTFGSLPTGFNRLNDNLEVRIIDNDFIVSPWGTPLAPTYGNVTPDVPSGYYDPIDGLSNSTLVQAVQDLVADPATVRSHTYSDVIDILKEADQSPLNSNQVWLLYTEQQRPKLDFQTSGGSNVGLWNREHTYPRSRGGFNDIEADEIADGIDIWVTTEADSLRHANSDAHGLRATDGPENSVRGNKDYGEYSGPSGTQGSWQGDVARSVLFLTIRYNGLEVVNGDPANTTVGQLGDLATLLTWHRNDPPDDYEMNRNNIVYNWQLNRNPFIDQPDLVEYIWGTNVGDIWMNTLSTDTSDFPRITVFPNPITEYLNIKGVEQESDLQIFNSLGDLVLDLRIQGNERIYLEGFSSGLYLLKIASGNNISTRRIIIN